MNFFEKRNLLPRAAGGFVMQFPFEFRAMARSESVMNDMIDYCG